MILKTQRESMVASFADLKETYAALTGEPLPEMDIAAARTRVSMVMLANVNHQHHSGVPANTADTSVKTIREMQDAGVPVDLSALNPYREGTLIHEVKAAALAAPPCERRPQIVKAREKPEGKHAPLGRRIGWKAVPGGLSRLQAASSRAAVLSAVRALTEQGRIATEEELAAAMSIVPGFSGSVKQHLQKLLEVAHVAPVYAQEGGEA